MTKKFQRLEKAGYFFPTIGIFFLGISIAYAEGSRARYEVTDLGTLGGSVSRAYAINNEGHVVGEAETADGQLHAFLWSKEKGMSDIGTLGGSLSRANEINDRAMVVGEAETEKGTLSAFRWSEADGMKRLDQPRGVVTSFAYGINNFGFIVGAGETDSGSHALIWSVDGVTELALLPEAGSSVAHDINDIGDAVGQGETGAEETNVSQALVYRNCGSPENLVVLEPGLSATARAINRQGQIAGYTEISIGQAHAFLFDTNGVQDIDTQRGAFSAAYGLNDHSQVVGVFFNSQGDDDHAFLYSDGEMLDLNDLIDAEEDWQLIEAWDINNAGQIVGYGLLNENDRAFLLTPVATKVSQMLPHIRLTSPAGDETFIEPSTIKLEAAVSAQGDIRRVVFYANGQILGSTNAPPYILEWQDVAAGEYDFTARVFDGDGRAGTSRRVRVRVDLASESEPEAPATGSEEAPIVP